METFGSKAFSKTDVVKRFNLARPKSHQVNILSKQSKIVSSSSLLKKRSRKAYDKENLLHMIEVENKKAYEVQKDNREIKKALRIK